MRLQNVYGSYVLVDGAKNEILGFLSEYLRSWGKNPEQISSYDMVTGKG